LGNTAYKMNEILTSLVSPKINSQLSFLLVTYHKDFDMLDGLLTSIVKNFSNQYRLLVILNDDKQHIFELQAILDQYPLVYEIKCNIQEVIHKKITHEYFGIRNTDSGWVTQQMLTLLASKIIETPYYLHICSKDRFIKPFSLSDIISNGKVRVLQEDWEFIEDSILQTFRRFYKNSCNFFKLDSNTNKDKIIKSITPVVNNTASIKKMLDEISNMGYEIADLIGIDTYLPEGKSQNKMSEYHLYCGWLAKHNLTNEILEFYSHNESPYYMEQTTYELRRK